jgi:hypothetical protein
MAIDVLISTVYPAEKLQEASLVLLRMMAGRTSFLDLMCISCTKDEPMKYQPDALLARGSRGLSATVCQKRGLFADIRMPLEV